MKTLSIILAAFLCLAALPLSAQTDMPKIAFGIKVTNSSGAEEFLVIGAADGATSGLDNVFDEYELPPLPPAEVFDARIIGTPGKSNLGSGSLTDYRGYPGTPGQFTETYTIGYQAGQGASGVTLAWEKPFPSRVISCTVDGKDVNTNDSITTQFAQGQVTVVMVMTSAPLSITASPSSLTLSVENRQELPTAEVDITCVNDKDALWDQYADVAWLTVNPMSGSGDQTLNVAVNTSLLQPGSYSGNITVEARFGAASVVIPVNIQVTVGVDGVPQVGKMWLGQNYPNPVHISGPAAPGTAMIPITLGAGGDHNPRLVVFDVAGRTVVDLSSLIRESASEQQIEFSTAGLPAGTYWYKLTDQGQTLTRTLLLVK